MTNPDNTGMKHPIGSLLLGAVLGLTPFLLVCCYNAPDKAKDFRTEPRLQTVDGTNEGWSYAIVRDTRTGREYLVVGDGAKSVTPLIEEAR